MAKKVPVGLSPNYFKMEICFSVKYSHLSPGSAIANFCILLSQYFMLQTGGLVSSSSFFPLHVNLGYRLISFYKFL